MLDEELEARWLNVQRRAVDRIRAGERAWVAELDDFLQEQVPDALRAEALAFRASMMEESDTRAAQGDYRAAHSLMDQPSYARYTVELCLGDMSERFGEVTEKIAWYRRALETCIAAEDVSGSTALNRFVGLHGERELTREDLDLCRRALIHSWTVLRLDGVPDLGHLSDSIAALGRAEAAPRREEP